MPELQPSKKPLDPSAAKDAIATAFSEFSARRKPRNANEAQTRIGLIDRILAALGWAFEDIEREVPSGSGSFLDYELIVDQAPWLVVEAKKASLTFEISSSADARQSFLQNIPSLIRRGGPALREVMNQAASYCNHRAIPLACVTNGFQWLFFRGLSSKERAWNKGAALVFDSPEDVLARFDDFFGALSRTKTGTSHLQSLLDRQAPASPPSFRVPRDHISMRKPKADAERFLTYSGICDLLLSDIYGDDRNEMLELCYVEPSISSEFEGKVQRLLRDTSLPFDSASDHVLDGDTKRFADELSRRETFSNASHPVLVVGHVGAGKTTFLRRAVARLREDRGAICAIVNLEGRGLGGVLDSADEEAWVAEQTTQKLSNAARTALKHNPNINKSELEQADPYSPVALKTLMRHELEQERRLGEKLWTSNPSAWDQKEYEILSAAQKDPMSLLRRFVRHLNNRFKTSEDKKYSILIVFDNVDMSTDDYQRCIYGLSQRLAKDTCAVVVVCLREDTFARGREPGGFLTSSPLPFVFHVAAPSLGHVLRQRVKFGESPSIKRGRIWTKERDSVLGFCKTIRDCLLPPKSESLELFSCLCGSNVRDALGLVRNLVLGGIGLNRVPDHTAAFAFEAMQAAMGHKDLQGKTMLFNCIDADPATPPNHALRTRLLAYFSWATDSQKERALLEQTEKVLGNFTAWGYPIGSIHAALNDLLIAGLLRPFAIQERGRYTASQHLPERITLTAAGHAHLSRLLALPSYRTAMACATRWYDTTQADEFIRRAHASGGDDGVTLADIQESKATSIFDAYLSEMIAREDAQLSHVLDGRRWIGEVKSRSALLLPPIPEPEVVVSAPIGPKIKPSNSGQDDVLQLNLFGSGERMSQTASKLALLSSQARYKESVYIPRILWALEWARLNRASPITASEIARVLKRNANVEVSSTNIARAFRDLKNDDRVKNFWKSSSKRYEITSIGVQVLIGIMSDDELASVG